MKPCPVFLALFRKKSFRGCPCLKKIRYEWRKSQYVWYLYIFLPYLALFVRYVSAFSPAILFSATVESARNPHFITFYLTLC